MALQPIGLMQMVRNDAHRSHEPERIHQFLAIPARKNDFFRRKKT
ncbi:hypothetical protein [Rhodanobacter sp. C06]|nr:hypothetical protein [Rhodanobacter sp. C06]